MGEQIPETSQEEPKEEPRGSADVEEEVVGDVAPASWRGEPPRIRVRTVQWPLRHVLDMMSSGDLDLEPEYQRFFSWGPIERSRLIESILLGIPLPAFYLNEDLDGRMQVVDGAKRLRAIHMFVAEGDALSGLEYLWRLEGMKFEQLEPALRRRFLQTPILLNVIEPQTPDHVKFDVFKRLNTGNSSLSAQEIRNAMSRSRSRLLLAGLVQLPSFRAATDGAFAHERRMADLEVALRFCAFRSLRALEDYCQFASLDLFLLDFSRRVDGVHSSMPAVPEAELQRLATDFDRAMQSAFQVFGPYAFRKYPVGAKKRGPINRALFESWAVALAEHEPGRIAPHAQSILGAARQRMGDPDYNAAISSNTGQYAKVLLRFRAAQEIVRRFLP
jgi:hypothetical protein